MKRTLLFVALLALIGCATSQRAIADERADGPPVLTLDHGMLHVQTAAGPVLAGLRLRLRFADGSALSGDLQAAGQDSARRPPRAPPPTHYHFCVHPPSPQPGDRAQERALQC